MTWDESSRLVPGTSLESQSGARRGGKPSGPAAGSQPCAGGGLLCRDSSRACRGVPPSVPGAAQRAPSSLLGSRGAGERAAVAWWPSAPLLCAPQGSSSLELSRAGIPPVVGILISGTLRRRRRSHRTPFLPIFGFCWVLFLFFWPWVWI